MLPCGKMLLESTKLGVEISHDVVITEVEKKMKIWREIIRTGGDREGVDVMNVDEDITSN